MRKSLVKRLAITLDRYTTPTKWLAMLKPLSFAVVLMMTVPATASAVGLGGMNVTSALGQSLKADIELVAISKAEKDSLVARLAPPEAYKNSGLEYPYGNKFSFEILSHTDGLPYIKVSSAQPVNDPFVSLLVELTWSAGKLSREYTFLLDPPGYVPEQPAPAKVAAVAPVVQTPELAESAMPAAPQESKAIHMEQVAPIVTPVEQVPPEETAVTSEEQAAPAEVQVVPTEVTLKPAGKEDVLDVAELPENPEFLAVKRGDTMYELAEKYKQPDMDLDRMLVALYRANADKFDGKNMNRIRSGKVLRLPTQEEYSDVSQVEAVKEIHAQAADWNAYRQKLAGAASESKQSQETQQVATGKISSSVADMAPVAKETAREVLKLSKGEAPGDKIAAGGGVKPMSEQDKNNAAQEDAIAKDKSLKEGQERTALLEKNLQDMQRLAQLKVEAAALAKAQEPPVTKVPDTATANPVKPPPTPVAVVKPQPKPVQQEPSLLDQILEEPLYLAGGAAALLALGGLGFMVQRRKKAVPEEFVEEPAEDIGSTTGRMASPVMPSPDTGDFTVASSRTQITEAAQTDDVDPISEADLFLNFGRDVQAEEILKEALQNAPKNHQIHLKLLGIYANRKDTNSFSAIARQLKDAGDDDAWQQAVAMGRKLEPDNPMYGGGFKSIEDTGSATVQIAAFNPAAEPKNVPKAQASALDFDFDIGASTPQETASPEQDFLGDSTEQTSVMSDDGRLLAQNSGMDFDITASQTQAPGSAGGMDFDITSSEPSVTSDNSAGVSSAPFSDDLVFDVTGGHTPINLEKIQLESSTTETEDGGMAFTLDFPVEEEAEKPAPAAQSAGIGLEGINLNFDDVPATGGSPAENKDEHWQDVATKLDLAKAYHEMGDASGAREILEEVLREGDAEQRENAQALLDQLS